MALNSSRLHIPSTHLVLGWNKHPQFVVPL
ncbi:hypothetical protein VP150E351_P0005 [Vibrio phage 150E35-1]|nr:hypothetical protein VP150E351_P0005 [Vibrio phage 150E35-1]